MNKTRPVRPKQGDTVKASHMVNHAQAIEELQNKILVSEKIQNRQFRYKHPFKMFSSVDSATSERRLYIQNGSMTTYGINSDGTPSVVNLPVQFGDGASDLSNTDFPQNFVEGYFVLSSNKTYGVWVVANDYTGAHSPESDLTDYSSIRTYSPVFTGLPYVYITDISDQIALGDESNVVLDLGVNLTFYIGQVITDSNNSPTIKKFRKSDIFAQMTTLPYNFIIVSADADNSIIAGSDGKAFYDAPPASSADANNSISVGSDGGPFYDAP